MKALYALLVLLLLFASCTTREVKKAELPFVTDSADVLTMNQVIDLRNMYVYYQMQTGNRIGLLTIKDVKPEKDLNAYSLKYFNENDLGRDNMHHSILIVFCASCHGVQVLSGKSTDKRVAEPTVTSIIHNIMIPSMEYGRDYEGLLKGSKAIIALLDSVKHK